METLNKFQSFKSPQPENDMSRWTAGHIISSHESKGFNRTGQEMKMRNMKTYIFEVYPPKKLAQFMQQPSPDIIDHLKHEGIDTHSLNRRQVSFLARVSLPNDIEFSAVEITLISEQRQNGGVYRHEINFPQNMLCLRESPVDTILDSLNNALHRYNWYPPY